MKRLIAAAVVVFAVCGTVFSNDCRFEGASNGKLAGGAIVFPFRIGASAMSPEAVQHGSRAFGLVR